jgi:RNA polymerase primary sigma factor
VHIGQRERKIARATQTLATELGRDPTDEEIAAAAELPVEQVIEVKDAARTVTSLDRPVGEGDETAFGDLLPGDAPTPDEEVEIGFREEILHRALEKLPEQERKVVKLRYGINGDNPTPLREAGQMLGMSAEGVRKLEKRALERLAQQREIEGLQDAA